MNATRLHTVTQKIESRFGSHYAHVSFDGGRVVELAFSSPGKFSDTALGDLLIALSDGVNKVIAQIGGDA